MRGYCKPAYCSVMRHTQVPHSGYTDRMPEIRPSIFDLDPASLRELCRQWDMPPYRAEQILQSVYQQHLSDPLQMTTLSKRERELLAAKLAFTTGQVVRHQTATDGTQKLLVEWPPDTTDIDSKDHHSVQRSNTSPIENTVNSVTPLPVLPESDKSRQTECVMIPAEAWEGGRSRRTACVSSQVGCPVGCRFCASGLDGLDGNLTAGQIIEQVWRLGSLAGVERISNVVFMGMGEPLANFPAVTRAINALMADWGLGISGRRITLSTVGLPAQIRRLAELNLPITLAISLHAPNDELRRSIIPWAEFVSIDEILDAGMYYFDHTGRELTLEYILLGGVNDQSQHARELVKLVRRLRANVNLIRYNQVSGLPFARPSDEAVRQFQNVLREAGVNVHIRASRGRDIAAACGQLRHEHQG